MFHLIRSAGWRAIFGGHQRHPDRRADLIRLAKAYQEKGAIELGRKSTTMKERGPGDLGKCVGTRRAKTRTEQGGRSPGWTNTPHELPNHGLDFPCLL